MQPLILVQRQEVGFFYSWKKETILTLFNEVKNVYTITRLTKNGEDFNEYPITLKNRYIRGVKVVSDEAGNLICAGLFSEAFFEGAKGIFFFKISSKDGRINANYIYKFNQEFIDRISENEQNIVQEKQLYKYVLSDLVLRNNGKIILIAEQLYNQTYETYNNFNRWNGRWENWIIGK